MQGHIKMRVCEHKPTATILPLLRPLDIKSANNFSISFIAQMFFKLATHNPAYLKKLLVLY